MKLAMETCAGCGSTHAVPKPPRLVICGDCESVLFANPVVQHWLQNNRERLLLVDRARLSEILERNPDFVVAFATCVQDHDGSATAVPQKHSTFKSESVDRRDHIASPIEVDEPFIPLYGTLTCRRFANVLDATGRTGSLTVETFVIRVVANREQSTNLGVKFTCSVEGTDERFSGDIPFGELQEAIDAFDAIASTGSDIADQRRDYTEVFYDSSTQVRYGFSQTVYGQTPFIQLPGGAPFYMSVEQFFELRDSVEEGRTRLLDRAGSAGIRSSEEKEATLRHILLAAHPAFDHFATILDVPYRVFFTNESELDAWLGVRNWKPVERQKWDVDSRREWLSEDGGQYIKLRTSLFDTKGRLRAFTEEEWDNEYIQVAIVPATAPVANS